MMDSTSITRLQRRKPCKHPGANNQARGPGGARFIGPSALWLIAGLGFFAPGLSGRPSQPGQLALPVLTLRAAYGQDFAAAGQHFSSAQDAFAQGKYEQAAKEFQAAYDITHDSSMLVNIGESWQRAGDGKKALVGYRAYLAVQPQAPDRSEIEGRIQAIATALAEAAPGSPAGAPAPGTSPTPPAPASLGTPSGTTQSPGPATPPVASPAGAAPAVPPAVGPGLGLDKPSLPEAAKPDASSGAGAVPPATPTTRLRTAAWVTVAIAVALMTSGAIVGLGAQDRADELRRRTTLLIGNQPPVYDAGQAEAYTTLQSEGRTYNQAGIALLCTAGAVAVTAGILFIVDYARRPKTETRSKGSWALVPTLLPGAASAPRMPVAGGLAASGSF